MNIGFVGTGKMGGQFARRLLEAGHDLSVYDLRREATTSLCEMGAHWVEGPKAAAQEAEIVLTSLPNPGAVEAVALDPDNGIIAGMRSGGTYADLSTSPPWLSVKVAAAFRAAGKRALDTPVSNGGVFMTIGGDPDAFTEYRPVFETISQNVYYMGGPGMGQVAKLVRQYVAFAAFTAESEAMLIAAKAGAPMETMADFMTKSVGRASHLERVWPSILKGDFETPLTGTLDIVAKDVSLAVELARQVKAPADVGLVVNDMLARGQAQGWGQRNWWAAVEVLEESAQIQARI